MHWGTSGILLGQVKLSVTGGDTFPLTSAKFQTHLQNKMYQTSLHIVDM